MILLLRPLLLKQVACIFSNEESNASQEDLEELNNICFGSARSNLRTMIDLRSYGLVGKSLEPILISHIYIYIYRVLTLCYPIARLGFMENMHLFTSLMILCLAMSINSQRPGSFHQKDEDISTYEAGKDVLRYMMQSGSLAAKGHLGMLKEVEDLGNIIATDGRAGTRDEGEHWVVDEWITQWFGDCSVSNNYGW